MKCSNEFERYHDIMTVAISGVVRKKLAQVYLKNTPARTKKRRWLNRTFKINIEQVIYNDN